MDFSPTLIERFWRNVDTSGGPTACWPWTGSVGVTRGGRHIGRLYNMKTSHPRVLKAHRVALAIATGEMPEDRDACHACDTPLCCNPSHLSWGTHRANMHDYIQKHGRVAISKADEVLPPMPVLPGVEKAR